MPNGIDNSNIIRSNPPKLINSINFFFLGDFKSFGFPNDYEKNLINKYSVVAPAGKVIKLTWVEFEVEAAGYPYDSSGCYDYVKVTDSDGVILMDKACNKALPDPVEYISKTNKIWIEHFADGASQEKGYHFRWTSEDPPSGRRKRQTISLVKERELECVDWLGGTGGYWKYDKTIPKACYSKESLLSKLHSLFSQELTAPRLTYLTLKQIGRMSSTAPGILRLKSRRVFGMAAPRSTTSG